MDDGLDLTPDIFASVGITDTSLMLSLLASGVTGNDAKLFIDLGITDPGDMKTLGEAGVYSGEYEQFTTFDVSSIGDVLDLVNKGLRGFHLHEFASVGFDDISDMLTFRENRLYGDDIQHLLDAGIDASVGALVTAYRQCHISQSGVYSLKTTRDTITHALGDLGDRLLEVWAAPGHTATTCLSSPAFRHELERLTHSELGPLVQMIEEHGSGISSETARLYMDLLINPNAA